MESRTEIAKGMFKAFLEADRDFAESHLAEDLMFHSPADPVLDRDGYFERCWPAAGSLDSFEFVRVVESGEEVIATYEARRPDGTWFRNTEVHTFDGSMIRRIEVYFGWDLD